MHGKSKNLLLTLSFSIGRPNIVVAYEFICSVYRTLACFLSPSKLAIFNRDKTPKNEVVFE